MTKSCIGLIATVLLGTYASMIQAQSYRNVAPIPAPAPNRNSTPEPSNAPPQPAASTEAVLPELHGLVFVPSPSDLNRNGSTETGVHAHGLPVLDEKFLQSLEPRLGKPLTLGALNQIKDAVAKHYKEAGYAAVDSIIPEQDVNNGVVQILVLDLKVGKVTARGNRYFSSALLEREMPLHPDDIVSNVAVQQGIALLNSNPYRQVDLIYTPSETPQRADVILQTQDRFPFRAYAGYDNAGVHALGRDRYFAGADYGNLFGLDQQIGYQVTASTDLLGGNPAIDGRPDQARFLAHSVNYVAPLPWFDKIELFGVLARSVPRLPDGFGQVGRSAQLSFRYDLHLPVSATTTQQLQIGYDFKKTNNNLEFGGTEVVNANTHINQFLLTYTGTRIDSVGSTQLTGSVTYSPGGLGGQNTDDAFNAFREGAKARYYYLQLGFNRETRLGKGFSLSNKGLMQWTNSILLPSEELSLGGPGTIRGYDVNVVQGDRGILLQNQLNLPAVIFGNWFSGTAVTGIQPYVFADVGRVVSRGPQSGLPDSATLASAGVGTAFQLGRFVSFRIDLARQLKHIPGGLGRATMGQMSLVIGS